MAMNEGKWRELLKSSLNCRLKFIEHDSMRCFISIDETFKSDSIPHRATIYQRVNKFCCGETKNFKAEILEVDRCRELWKSQKWVEIVSANGCWWWCGAAWSSRSSQFVTHTATIYQVLLDFFSLELNIKSHFLLARFNRINHSSRRVAVELLFNEDGEIFWLKCFQFSPKIPADEQIFPPQNSLALHWKFHQSKIQIIRFNSINGNLITLPCASKVHQLFKWLVIIERGKKMSGVFSFSSRWNIKSHWLRNKNCKRAWVTVSCWDFQFFRLP